MGSFSQIVSQEGQCVESTRLGENHPEGWGPSGQCTVVEQFVWKEATGFELSVMKILEVKLESVIGMNIVVFRC